MVSVRLLLIAVSPDYELLDDLPGLVTISLTLVALITLRRGYVNPVALSMSAYLTLYLVGSAAARGGVRSISTFFISVPIVVAFLTLGRRAGVAVTSIAVLSPLVLVWLKGRGSLPEVREYSEWSHAIGVDFSFITIAVFLFLVTRKSDAALALAQTKEQEMVTLVEVLEERVRERTAALNAAKERAEDADRAKGLLLATVSHEMRTPLNGVIGMADLLVDANLTQEQGDLARTICDSGRSLLLLINDLLDVAKIEAKGIKLEVLPFALRDLAEATMTMLRSKAVDKGLAFSLHVGPAVPESINGDSMRLQQILINLLNNAIKFTQQGEISLSVTATPGRSTSPGSPAAKQTITWAVRDSGIGISAENQEHLFKAFHQADASITRKYGGTGLGLAISKSLVELMGGTLIVESTLGRGSTFSCVLPSTVAEPTTGKVQATVRFDPDTAAQMPLRILLVDDNLINRRVAETYLKKLGYALTVASDGEDAVSRVQSGNYDLVLMDVHMPIMDGLEATKRIRGDADIIDQPYIVAMTASAMVEDLDACLASGMDHHLSKPLTLTLLLQTLRRASAKPRESSQ